MSHSPEVATAAGKNRQFYVAAWDAAERMLRDGRSWSGRERNCIFLNCGTMPFADISAASGLDFPDDARALSLVDWDQDGDLDVWLRNRTAPRLRLMLNGLNDADRRPSFLALLLEGTECNRDAIGARVEVALTESTSESEASSESQGSRFSQNSAAGPQSSTLVKTLRTSGAYLSQSSKWLHFGLGQRGEIEQVTVRWPGGATESFSGATENGRFLLVQGRGRAQEWTPPRPTIQLPTSDQRPEQPVAASRAFFPVRLPLPGLPFLNYEDLTPRSIETEAGPLLVTFWASWCAPCVSELQQLAEREADLRDAGLNVLALTVDGLDRMHTSQPSDAQNTLESMSFPFEAAVATPELLDKLEELEDILFVRRLRFAVPYSLLLDHDGRLAAIYRGQVNIDTLLEDVSNLDVTGTRLRDASLPFRGRWLSKLGNFGPAWIAGKWQFTPYHEDTVHFLDMALADPQDRETLDEDIEEDSQNRLRLYRTLAAKLLLLGRYDEAIARAREGLSLHSQSVTLHLIQGDAMRGNGQFQEAIQPYEAATQIDAESHPAWLGMGLAYGRLNQHDQAAEALEKAIALDPGNHQAHFFLAQAREQLGQSEEAESSYREVLANAGDHAGAHRGLASLLREAGRIGEAVDHYRRAATLQPENAAWRHDLAMALVVTGQPSEAMPHFRETVRIEPDRLGALNALAWLLATQSQPRASEAAEAIQLAERAVEITAHKDAGMLDTLAAAYAAAGQFEQARSTAKIALEAARQQGNSKLENEIGARLELYENSEPYVERSPSR